MVPKKPAAAIVGIQGVLQNHLGMSSHVCMGTLGWMGGFYWACGSVLAWGRLWDNKVMSTMSYWCESIGEGTKGTGAATNRNKIGVLVRTSIGNDK